MKKSTGLIFLLTLNLVFVFFFWQYSTTKADQKGPIPQNAIRLRILANSDAPADQAVKRQVRDAVNADITRWVGHLKTAGQAKRVIRAHLPQLKQTVARTLRQARADGRFNIALGKADFPTKMYGSFVYPAGRYDALVITLGDGQGANWWCVLFPPLCFLDFSNSDAVSRTHTQDQKEKSSQSAPSPAVEDDQQTQQNSGSAGHSDTNKVQVHSFIFDFFSGIWHAVAG